MYQFAILPHFKKQLKPLAKKYVGLKDDIIETLENINQHKGNHLGKNIYKLRIKLASSNKGKSGGFRLIIFIVETDEMIYPLAIYFKGDQDNIAKQEIEYHLSCVLDDINKL